MNFRERLEQARRRTREAEANYTIGVDMAKPGTKSYTATYSSSMEIRVDVREIQDNPVSVAEEMPAGWEDGFANEGYFIDGRGVPHYDTGDSPDRTWCNRDPSEWKYVDIIPATTEVCPACRENTAIALNREDLCMQESLNARRREFRASVESERKRNTPPSLGWDPEELG